MEQATAKGQATRVGKDGHVTCPFAVACSINSGTDKGRQRHAPWCLCKWRACVVVRVVVVCLLVGPLSVQYLDMRRCSRRRQTGKHTDDSREQRTGNKRRVRSVTGLMRLWWLVAGGWRPHIHGGVVLAARQSAVLSNRWELDLALWRSEHPHTTRHHWRHVPERRGGHTPHAAFGGGFEVPTQ